MPKEFKENSEGSPSEILTDLKRHGARRRASSPYRQGADLAGTAGGRDALAAHTSRAQYTFTQTTRIDKENRLVLAQNAVLVEYRYFQSHMLCV